MRLYAFEPASNRGDLDLNWMVLGEDGQPVMWDLIDDVVTLAFGCDEPAPYVSDYGRNRLNSSRPFYSASSVDGSGVVTLVNPGWIVITVPATAMGGIPQEEIRMALAYERQSTKERATMWIGRIPIFEGLA
jgi:hypothetical protein